MSEFEKDLGKKKEGTDTLNQNQENSTKPAVPAEGENNAPAAPAKKKFAAVYRPQNSTQKRPAGNLRQYNRIKLQIVISRTNNSNPM